MAKKQHHKHKMETSGLPIDELIIKPLVAISKAQSKMAEEQIRTLLKSCFYFDGNHYKPIMIKLSLTRSFLEASDSIEKAPHLNQVVSYFNIPLLTLFPISSLGIESVSIAFEMEVISQYAYEDYESEEYESPVVDSKKGPKDRISKIEMLGRISSKKYTLDNYSKTTSESFSSTNESMYSIDLIAGNLPLSKGLKSIIDIYTKSIDLAEMPFEKN
jgi:hypothetical protein